MLLSIVKKAKFLFILFVLLTLTTFNLNLSNFNIPLFQIKEVHFNNTKYFQEEINTIRFKNNQSNWGSCSSKKNLNFSTRLLFAPQEAIDYVIVHELAHLKELNHSPKFWKIVADVMPNYKEQEAWLKANGHLCQF